jgi:hypothetical protein
MAGLDMESVGLGQLGGEYGECLVGNLDHLSAPLAQQVLVAILGQVIRGGAVAEMDMLDDPELLQRGEVAVNGRLGHVGVKELHLAYDVFGAEVRLPSIEQDPDGGPPGIGSPSAPSPNLADDRFNSVGRRHRRSLLPACCVCGHDRVPVTTPQSRQSCANTGVVGEQVRPQE